MIDCRRTVEQLTPFVDGALPAEERAHIERHLDQCPPCRRTAAKVEGGRTVLRERAAQMRTAAVPPDLRSRCEALAQKHGQRSAPPWSHRFAPTFAIAVLLIGTGLVLFALATRSSDMLLAQQLTVDHMKCFRLFGSPQADAIEARTAEATFANQYGWDVHVPPSSTQEGVTLVGARRCLYASGPIPHVMYRINGQNVSLFMLDGVARAPADLVTLGHRSQIWSEHGKTYVLVSPRDSAGINQAVHYVREQTH